MREGFGEETTVTGSADEDRRKETRLSPGDLECDVEGTRFAHVLGVTIGGHGMRVMTDRKLPGDQTVKVVFHLSDSDDLEFDGQMVWTEEKNFDFTQRFISGVRFVDPTEGACHRLHSYIESFLAREHPEQNPTSSAAGDPA